MAKGSPLPWWGIGEMGDGVLRASNHIHPCAKTDRKTLQKRCSFSTLCYLYVIYIATTLVSDVEVRSVFEAIMDELNLTNLLIFALIALALLRAYLTKLLADRFKF